MRASVSRSWMVAPSGPRYVHPRPERRRVIPGRLSVLKRRPASRAASRRDSGSAMGMRTLPQTWTIGRACAASGNARPCTPMVRLAPSLQRSGRAQPRHPQWDPRDDEAAPGREPTRPSAGPHEGLDALPLQPGPVQTPAPSRAESPEATAATDVAASTEAGTDGVVVLDGVSRDYGEGIGVFDI